eukprot:jgi/Tetstr1/421831/TSEL_012732.t1
MAETEGSAASAEQLVHALLVGNPSSQDLLEACKYRVSHASNARGAAKQLAGNDTSTKSETADVILFDPTQPECSSSYAELAALAEAASKTRTPIIAAMPGAATSADVASCLSAGATDCLIKPLRRNELTMLWQHAWRSKAALEAVSRGSSGTKYGGAAEEERSCERNGAEHGHSPAQSGHSSGAPAPPSRASGRRCSAFSAFGQGLLPQQPAASQPPISLPVASLQLPGVSQAYPAAMPPPPGMHFGPMLLPPGWAFAPMPHHMAGPPAPDLSLLYMLLQQQAQLSGLAAAAGVASAAAPPLAAPMGARPPEPRPAPASHPPPPVPAEATPALPSSHARRASAILKFREKRKMRNFDKKVRYQSRKKLAEERPRVRGQFVKRGENDDVEGELEAEAMTVA